jgi:Branched-chain amino acid ATP-binding cassette transporter
MRDTRFFNDAPRAARQQQRCPGAADIRVDPDVRKAYLGL